MKKLDDLFQKLEENKQVDAVFITGSSAIGSETKDSDIDLVIVLQENSKKLRSVYEVIDNRFADIFFFTTDNVKDLLNQTKVTANEMSGMFVTWLQKSKIVFDKSNVTTQLKEKLESIKLVVTEDERFRGVQAVSYSYYHNHRYYRSGKSEYLAALEIRLCQSVLEIFTTYFALRELPWRGEKYAVQIISETSPNLYKAWNDFLAASSIDGRMQAYEIMVKELLQNDVTLFDYQTPVVIGEDLGIDRKILKDEWNKLSR